jgi:RimJ/RimL family protein N-acetyltransferase
LTTEATSPLPFQVRALRWSDFDDLRETYYLLYAERDAGYPIGIGLFGDRPSLADEARWFHSLFGRVLDGSTIASIAEANGHAVGGCYIGRVGPTEDSEAAHVGELGILVHRDWRGRGVGSALLKDALGRCRGKFEIVRLAVFVNNPRARALYERFGFVPYGRLPKALRRGGEFVDEDLMYLDLGPAHTNR